MIADDWPPVDPPLEAYSRVTNPDRFRALHQRALELLDRLEARYDVSRTEDFDLLPEMTPFEHARPPIRLTPAAAAAAPIAVAFTTFPGLLLRYGRWHGDKFPSCGCDACRETADGEGERLGLRLDAVIAGRFRERIRIPLIGQSSLTYELGDVDARTGFQSGGRHVVSRAVARALLGDGPRIVRWQPWPTRVA